jgi:hypothetical protein
LVCDIEENAIVAAKFFLYLAMRRNEHFMALGDDLQAACAQKLAAADGSSKFTDLLIALLLQFPLSPETETRFFQHFPIASAPLAFAHVYPWVLVQLRETPEATRLLLASILRLFCLDLKRLVQRKKLSGELVQSLFCVLNDLRASPVLAEVAREVTAGSDSDPNLLRRGLAYAQSLFEPQTME